MGKPVLQVFYDCVLMGQAFRLSRFPGLSSLLFTLAPPLAQLDTTGFTWVIWNASPSHEVSHLPLAVYNSERIRAKLWVVVPSQACTSGEEAWVCESAYIPHSHRHVFESKQIYLFSSMILVVNYAEWILITPRARSEVLEEQLWLSRDVTLCFSPYAFLTPAHHCFPGHLQQCH